MFLKNKRVLVTGGSSFIGRNLIPKLISEGALVYNVSKRGSIDGVQNILVDLTKDTLSSLEEINPDFVVHLAAFSSPARCPEDDEATRSLNVGVTSRLIEYFSGKPIKKFIFTSSVVVYEPMIDLLKEESPLRKSPNRYALSKIDAEKTCLEAIGKGFPAVVLRLTNTYGPYQQWKKEDFPTIIPQMIVQALLEKKIEIKDPTPIRDFIHVSDVVESIIRVLSTDYTGILNVGTGLGISMGELSSVVAEATGSTVTTQSIQQTATDSLVLDISQLEKVIQWKPKIKIGEGIANTVEYYNKELKKQ